MEQNKRIRKIVNSIKQPSKNCIWLKNGKLYYYSTTGWTEIQGQDKVNIESIKEVTITENGKITITPSEGYDATMGVTASVQVTGKPKTLDIAKNGTYTVTGDDQPISQVTINAKVTEVATTWTDLDGMKYSYSTITKFQDGYKFAPRTGDNCYQMFSVCSNLITIPHFDTSNATDMTGMFLNCSSLTSVPPFDTSKVTNMSRMFYGCKALASIPLFNTTKVNNMDNLFDRSGITEVPLFDTSSVTSMNSMFHLCSKLTSVPSLNTRKVTNVKEMFYSCRVLESVGLLDLSNATNTIYMFYDCSNLTTLDGLTGLKDNLYLNLSLLLTKESLLNVINEAADVTANPKTLTFGATNLAKLTDDEKAIATSKGWTLA